MTERTRTSAHIDLRKALAEQAQGARTEAERRRARNALLELQGVDTPKPKCSATTSRAAAPKRSVARHDLSTAAGRTAAAAALHPEVARHLHLDGSDHARCEISPNKLTLHPGAGKPFNAPAFDEALRPVIDRLRVTSPEVARLVEPAAPIGSTEFKNGRLYFK